MDSTDTVIRISDLVKEYKMYSNKKDRLLEAILPKYQKHSTFRAMDNLNLEIKKGEVLGILGKNGAGKSTLLKMITGVVIPTSGKLEVNGKISSLLELGAAFNPDLTGYENIYQHGQVMGLSDEEIKEKEKEIIEFADIGEHLVESMKGFLYTYEDTYKKIYCFAQDGPKEEIEETEKALSGYRDVSFGKVGLSELKLDQSVTEKLDFIRIDVSEDLLGILQGCQGHIMKEKLKLAVCLDSDCNHLWQVPKLLMEWNPKYRFYLRYYGKKMIPDRVVLFAV